MKTALEVLPLEKTRPPDPPLGRHPKTVQLLRSRRPKAPPEQLACPLLQSMASGIENVWKIKARYHL